MVKRMLRAASALCLLALLLAGTALAADGELAIDESHFPDAAFRSYILENLDADGSGTLSNAEIAAVRKLSLYSNDIASLEGIRYFTNLTELYCTLPSMTELDLTGCSALEILRCAGIIQFGSLTSIQLQDCVSLRELDCDRNALTSLDVSSCPLLEKLSCGYNQLETLTLPSNAALTKLYCGSNSLTALEISSCPKLQVLECYSNPLTDLDIASCPELQELSCYATALTCLDGSGNSKLTELRCGSYSVQVEHLQICNFSGVTQLFCYYSYRQGILPSSLEIRNCPKITELDFGDNPSLSSLTIRDCPALKKVTCEHRKYITGFQCLSELSISGCPALEELRCGSNLLTVLDLSGFPNLTYLDCGGNALTELDLSVCSELTYLDCGGNALTQLEIRHCSGMEKLDCANNQLTSLDISNFSKLMELYCQGNAIPILEIGCCPKLTELNCSDTAVTELALSACRSLSYLDVSGTLLSHVNVSGFTALQSLCCSRMPLAILVDCSSCTSLQWLECNQNAQLEALNAQGCSTLGRTEYFSHTIFCCENPMLTSLDLTGCGLLAELECYDNALTALKLGGCSALTRLACRNNALAQLDLRACTLLSNLDCENNALTQLDFSSFSALAWLYCKNNALQTLNLSGCSALTYLSCENNALTELTLSGCTALINLNCESNALSALELGDCSALVWLYCGKNQLSALDVSGCSALRRLDCEQNALTDLSIHSLANLEQVHCYDNIYLTSIIISDCPVLSSLDCSGSYSYPGSLTSLILQDCPTLGSLSCAWNQLTSLDFSDCPELQYLTSKMNARIIALDAQNHFDLSQLPGFDVGKASNWTGGSVEGTVLTADYPDRAVQYTYDCGNGLQATFQLTSSTHVCTSWTGITQPPSYLHDGITVWHCGFCGKETRETISNNPFLDVGDGNRFKTAILWAYYRGITSGTNKEGTLFSPDATVTRGQFVMFLWRMAGKPEPTITESPFPDVQGNNSFRKAVLWAVEKGITAGQKDGTFGLNNPCTRGQVVAFLYRYAGKPAYITDKEAFPDVSENNSFYEAVMWAVEMGITNGQNDGSFGLKGECKRSHAATFLYKYDSLS